MYRQMIKWTNNNKQTSRTNKNSNKTTTIPKIMSKTYNVSKTMTTPKTNNTPKTTNTTSTTNTANTKTTPTSTQWTRTATVFLECKNVSLPKTTNNTAWRTC